MSSVLNLRPNLLGLSLPSLQTWVESQGEAKFRAQQLVQWIHQHGVTDPALMTNLGKGLRDKVVDQATIDVPQMLTEKIAPDGTRKWLLKLKDGNAIETVYIPEPDRATLCVSSQVGCALNCSFCATGKEGFNRNLSAAEIIGQVWFAVRRLKALETSPVTNVVMMGMGEPLLNYTPVLEAMRLMLSDYAYGLSKYRVTLSTAGVVPMMQQLKQDIPVALAVSLHAPTNELRDELVPLNKKYPLEVLIPACRDYFATSTKRMVTFEYVMLAGINDSLENAKQLVHLVREVPCKINLIPFNGFEGSRYQCSSQKQINLFQNFLMDKGLMTWVRRTRGDQIDGACGQLAGKFLDRTGRHERWVKTGRLTP